MMILRTVSEWLLLDRRSLGDPEQLPQSMPDTPCPIAPSPSLVRIPLLVCVANMSGCSDQFSVQPSGGHKKHRCRSRRRAPGGDNFLDVVVTPCIRGILGCCAVPQQICCDDKELVVSPCCSSRGRSPPPRPPPRGDDVFVCGNPTMDTVCVRCGEIVDTHPLSDRQFDRILGGDMAEWTAIAKRRYGYEDDSDDPSRVPLPSFVNAAPRHFATVREGRKRE